MSQCKDFRCSLAIAAASVACAVMVVTIANRSTQKPMNPAQIAAATRQCESAGWQAVLNTRMNGEQFVTCVGKEKAP